MVTVDSPRTVRRIGPARGLLTATRVLATVQVIGVLAQATLAGLYLSGGYDMLELHRHGADVVWYGGLVQLIVTTVLGWAGRLWWPAWLTLVMVIAETAQYFAGLGGALYVHIPLGVILAASACLLAASLWRPQTAARLVVLDEH